MARHPPAPPERAPGHVGTEGQTRGEGGELKIIQWQAATMANAHESVGTKDFLIGSMVQEPLMSYLRHRRDHPEPRHRGSLGRERDARRRSLSVTFTLQEGILWSDGEPLTSRDVQFTWQWITNPDNARSPSPFGT